MPFRTHTSPVSLLTAALILALCAGSAHAQDAVEADDAGLAPPAQPRLTLADLERIALADHPVLAEKELDIDKARERVRDVDMGVILPRFDLETGVGPAPGIREVVRDTLQRFGANPDPYFETRRRYDLGEWGPYFGIQGNIVQPLNFARYRAGRRAANLRVRVTEAEFKKEQIAVSEEAQEIYFQRLYALTMHRELDEARRDLDRAQRRISDLLDDGDESVSQTDLLQLRAGRYSLDQGWNEAVLGERRTALSLRFMLMLPDDIEPVLADSVLTVRQERIPHLDTLRLAALRGHPDLSRLRNGLAARQELLKVAQGEIGPDIFLFGSFQYTKSWSSDRQTGTSDPFARDPLNELTGAGGLGMRLRLNFWQRQQSYRKERLELRQLERTEVYAARGVLLRVEDAYLRAMTARDDVEEAQKALRAADAWLRGASMAYDLDPSEAPGMIAPFRQSLVAKRDFYRAVLAYNVAVARLFRETGWTLSDYLGSLNHGGSAAEEPR